MTENEYVKARARAIGKEKAIYLLGRNGIIGGMFARANTQMTTVVPVLGRALLARLAPRASASLPSPPSHCCQPSRLRSLYPGSARPFRSVSVRTTGRHAAAGQCDGWHQI